MNFSFSIVSTFLNCFPHVNYDYCKHILKPVDSDFCDRSSEELPVEMSDWLPDVLATDHPDAWAEESLVVGRVDISGRCRVSTVLIGEYLCDSI